ncbi:hypothetical protein [Flavicella sediminum]|uniref:hypothetical protein n=1 Tax=Flavicella sediminum TaxID=2585141 RepID=UPI001122AE4D|nr:hypothetical protein [Flavicella sediminum]
MKKVTITTFAIILSLFLTGCHKEPLVTDTEVEPKEHFPLTGYKVWLGTTCTPKNAILKPETWSRTAKLVEGLNVNNTPVLPAAGTPSEGEESLSTAQFNQLIQSFDLGNKNGFIPIPRTFFKSAAFPERADLIPFLENKFRDIDAAGYSINGIMFFDNFIGSSSEASGGVAYVWTEEEALTMRTWLDANRPNVKLYYNARNFSLKDRNWCENPLVDNVVIEAKPTLWYENKGSRQDLLKWLWTNPKTIHKRVIFQVPVHPLSENPYGDPNSFQQIREWVRWLGADLMGIEFLRSSRVVLMPVTYNPAFTFYPETSNNGANYSNTMTGIALSLIEQKNLFQGLDALPTKEDAYNMNRVNH